MAQATGRVRPEALPGRNLQEAFRRAAARARPSLADPRSTRLRSEQPHRPADTGRHVRCPATTRRFPDAHCELRGVARLSRREGTELPVGASALRYGVDPHARPACARNIAAAGWKRRGDVAIGADLAGLLFHGPRAS